MLEIEKADQKGGQNSLESQRNQRGPRDYQTHLMCIVKRPEIGQSPLVDRGYEQDQTEYQGQCR